MTDEQLDNAGEEAGDGAEKARSGLARGLNSLLEPLPPEVVDLRSDGSAVLHLGATDVTLPPLTLGQLRSVWILDDKYPIENVGRDGLVGNIEWLRGVIEAAGVDPPDTDDMPAWAGQVRVRFQLGQHWLTVPFGSGAGEGTPKTPTTSPRRNPGRRS